ncbi:MAG: single-stranded DNA-binding protein [Kiritimatiellae bacterium]|nr:single-stranded DNA-binding protein [Kiritimatiellia bacterium]
MPSFNKVIVMGNLTRDPDVRTVGMNAVKVCRFSLALNERRRDRNGNLVECPVFVEVDAWDKLGELCGQYLRKGRAALVEGRLQSDTWEKDGFKIQKLKIRAATVKFMPLPAPNQSRLTGEPLPPYGAPSAGESPSGDMDGYDAE